MSWPRWIVISVVNPCQRTADEIWPEVAPPDRVWEQAPDAIRARPSIAAPPLDVESASQTEVRAVERLCGRVTGSTRQAAQLPLRLVE
jgi:hypothetical protein